MSVQGEIPSETSSLSGSTYDLIDTDEESRDGNATESVASADFGGPDDVASLAEHSGDESDQEQPDPAGSIPALLQQSTSHTFDTPTVAMSRAIIHHDIEGPERHSIEFDESCGIGMDTVAVKHTVVDFDEAETSNIVRAMQMQSPPARLVMTIRQTMTRASLTTKDPLRILYTGSHAAKQDIIRKLASSVTASVDDEKHLRNSASQLYNVVPVTDFASDRTPEVELMHSSGYQINVEDCDSAQVLPASPDTITLTLDGSFLCHSSPKEQGYIIEPAWELPHIAIFYCSEGDSTEMRRTRAYVRRFMSRHNVPSIVISHKQGFKGQCMMLDQHSVHMCLESRDPKGRGNIIHQRLPIDLTSFLTIDARQMNRNLAYLTGLHHVSNASSLSLHQTTNRERETSRTEKAGFSLASGITFLRQRTGAEWRALLPLILLVTSVVTAIVTGTAYRTASPHAISVNSRVVSAVPISTSTTGVPMKLVDTAPVAVSTSTRTVTVTKGRSSDALQSLLVPSTQARDNTRDLNKALSLPGQRVGVKTNICSAEILGDREVLIRIPTTTKLAWLNHEAFSVNVTRDETTVDTERAYTSDDGIVLLLAKHDAYGVLNVSIITTKRPRVNETFQVDFGISKAQFVHAMFASLPKMDIQTLVASWSGMGNSTAMHISRAVSALSRLTGQATNHTLAFSTASQQCAKAWSLGAVKGSAILVKEAKLQLDEAERVLVSKTKIGNLQAAMQRGIVRAQVQSRLVWLAMQGKKQEYQRYEAAARAALDTQSKSRCGRARCKRFRN